VLERKFSARNWMLLAFSKKASLAIGGPMLRFALGVLLAGEVLPQWPPTGHDMGRSKQYLAWCCWRLVGLLPAWRSMIRGLWWHLVAHAREGKKGRQAIIGVLLCLCVNWPYIRTLMEWRGWKEKVVCDSTDTQSHAMTWCAALLLLGNPFCRIRDVDVKHDFAFVVCTL
jgi:hypothetical protein